ncbi:hypothetical protein EVJ50_14100 [Synechococcus sp. RSCCF101]|uniref:glycosyltransferase family 39 protein n=1 Tax=Synechococcus sp. RSCCF101 TaxID=2511069 RepID=UPI0012472AF0|nr:glycosyltransferase family 39 protein [Synechococcus sp. RSCCF101]QEY33198.1 hypothetical protein EVJ50_14100 [Synechococcus sp. RSCCF101]
MRHRTPQPRFAAEPLLTLLAGVVCAAFAARTFLLIDSSSLWGDELRSVIKSFQPSPGFILSYLRTDSHPPLYYLSLWGWGQAIGQTAWSLRAFSWLAYLLGGGLMALQAALLARHRRRAAVIAALLAFCTPFPVRFAIEGKSYALLVALIAGALILRAQALERPRRQGPGIGYALLVALSGFTHFYGLALLGATGLWDACRRRWRLALACGAGMVPGAAWIVHASGYLLDPSTNDWIAPPEFSLLTAVLRRALGADPFRMLAAIAMAVLVLQLWGRPAKAQPIEWRRLADRTGLWGGLLMVLLVVAVSFLRPIAFARYFIVLVPVLIPAVAIGLADWSLRPRAAWLALLLAAVAVVHVWTESFRELQPSAGRFDRERDDFRSVSLRLAGASHRYARRPELFAASDRVLLAAGRLDGPGRAWGEEDDLRQALKASPPPAELHLAAAGRNSDERRRLEDLKAISRDAGYRCEPLEELPRGAFAWRCTLPQRSP